MRRHDERFFTPNEWREKRRGMMCRKVLACDQVFEQLNACTDYAS